MSDLLNTLTTDPVLEQLALGDLVKSLLLGVAFAFAFSLLIGLVLAVATARDRKRGIR